MLPAWKVSVSAANGSQPQVNYYNVNCWEPESMTFRWCLCLVAIVEIVRCLESDAAERVHPKISAYERFYAAEPVVDPDDDAEPVKFDPVTGGRILLSELNCLSCHKADQSIANRLVAKSPPVLDEVGRRIKVDWLRAYLSNPHAVKPGTTMPDLLAAEPVESRKSHVEALVHFLASTGTVTETRPDASAIKKGAELIRKIGCLACHNGIDSDSPDLATSTPLPDVGKKYSAPSLVEFLRDPLKARPSGRMPSLSLTDDELRIVANFFVRDGVTTPNLRYSVYYGSWDTLPKFSELKPNVQGEAWNFDLSLAGKDDDFAIRFASNLRISVAGEYRFWLGSDDGSRLLIDGNVVVNNDGIHPNETNVGRIVLSPGFHKLEVEYFERGGEASLTVEISSQGMTRQPLVGHLYLDPNPPAKNPDHPEFTVDPMLVAKGRELFATVGCASCHRMTVDEHLIESKLSAKPFDQLKGDSGCLSEQPKGRSPVYGLNTRQRNSIALALLAKGEESVSERLHRQLATLNCYACHERGRIGGVEAARNATFDSLQKEMGEEGRLPPTLTGVGDKLRPEWLLNLLNNGANDRKNYLVARMPRFGAKNVSTLVEQFATADRQNDSMPEVKFGEPDYRVKAVGRHLVGGLALSCIKCHDFGTHPSTGVRAMNLTTMHQRIRPEWFYRYVLDPQVYRRGTRMPAPWPSGQATIRDVLKGDANQQIQAVWMYLSDGTKAAIPVGLIRESIELKATDEPIIYRNFIEGAGARAIGVGYPGGVNLAFDANEMRIAMIWHGAFIDASRHWTGRGQGFEPPLGDDVIPLPNRVPFIELDQPDREFPTQSARDLGYKFLGYDLDQHRRPVFKYSTPEMKIEDHIVPDLKPGKPAALQRKLRFDGKNGDRILWFRAAVGRSIEPLDGGRFRVDQVWSIGTDPNRPIKPLLRESVGQRELLIPVHLSKGHDEFTLQYDW